MRWLLAGGLFAAGSVAGYLVGYAAAIVAWAHAHPSPEAALRQRQLEMRAWHDPPHPIPSITHDEMERAITAGAKRRAHRAARAD